MNSPYIAPDFIPSLPGTATNTVTASLADGANAYIQALQAQIEKAMTDAKNSIAAAAKSLPEGIKWPTLPAG